MQDLKRSLGRKPARRQTCRNPKRWRRTLHGAWPANGTSAPGRWTKQAAV